MIGTETRGDEGGMKADFIYRVREKGTGRWWTGGATGVFSERCEPKPFRKAAAAKACMTAAKERNYLPLAAWEVVRFAVREDGVEA